MLRMVATIALMAIMLSLPMVAIATPTPEKQNQYFWALEQLSELPRNVQGINPDVVLKGYDLIVCAHSKKYMAIAVPDDPEMLGLIRSENGTIFNIYPAGDIDWPNDWPINFALSIYESQGEEAAQQWLNSHSFRELVTPSRFIWWDNSDHIIISQDFEGRYATIFLDEVVYYAVGRWNPAITSVEEFSFIMSTW
ncbi:MAG: hypothetical protein V1807_03110 [Patescibacteria group bacterium]